MSEKGSLSSYDNQITQVTNTSPDDDVSSNQSQGFGEYVIQHSDNAYIADDEIEELDADNIKQICRTVSTEQTGFIKNDKKNHEEDRNVNHRKSATDAGVEENTRRLSFKRQARLSRMLESDDLSTSDSDDDNLYTYGSYPHAQDPQRADDERLRSNEEEFQILGQKPIEDKSMSYIMNKIKIDSPNRESILSNAIQSNALAEGKSRLRKVEKTISGGPIGEQSPAEIWEMKKKKKEEKLLLNKAQASKLKAGWKVRQCLNSLPDGEDVNTLYHTLVRKGMLREVDALFSLAKVSRAARGLNKNFKDSDEKSALTIAIDNRNEVMMTRLLEYGVDLDMNVFHAIETDFIEGVKILMMFDPCVTHKIKDENTYFQIGMTPMLLAAHNNNYSMLLLLHEYGHQLPDLVEWDKGIQEAWESANERRMICEARAQPAFITLTTELNRMNPMKYCLQEIKKLREYASLEQAFSGYYKDIITKIEVYMCSLLDFISSSEELAALFQFEYVSSSQDKFKNFIEGSKTARYALENRFKLLEKASKENLIRFVTHQQSQLALTYLRYRSLPFLQNNFISISIGLLFPLLSIFYVVTPNTFLGSIITLPIVSFSCHMMSDIWFAVLLLLNIALKDVDHDRLGAGPTTVELLIFIWILGKWVQELQECINRGLKAYLRDNWNYSDLLMLLLFSTSIVIRVYDMVYNNNASTSIRRSEWAHLEPRLIAGGLQAWGYIFFFVRLLGIMRVDRTLGPLQISLAKMLKDVIRFLCLFALVILAFAFGLSDLYWYYGTKEGSQMFCDNTRNITGQNGTCVGKVPSFTTMPDAVVKLFWALFGLFELDSMSLKGKHNYTEFIGKTLVGTYHVVAIIVMLNMLIAMMSSSYDDTSQNEDTAWKFHRTSMWIRFIRREVVRPPPMNLFPNPWRLGENFKRFRKYILRLNCCKNSLTDTIYDRYGRRIESHTINTKLDIIEGCVDYDEKGQLTPVILSPTKPAYNVSSFRTVDAKLSSEDAKGNFTKKTKKGFTASRLEEVVDAMAVTLQNTGSKHVSMKLVRRYKLKHLVRRRIAETPDVI